MAGSTFGGSGAEAFAAFQSSLGDRSPVGSAPAAELERKLEGAIRSGRAAWSEIELDSAAFAARLGTLVQGGMDVLQELDRLRFDDIYLTCACLRGEAKALQAFEARAMSCVDLALARLDVDHAFVDELKQSLREELLLGVGGRPPLLLRKYSGRGKLRGLLAVVAMRQAQRCLKRREMHPAGPDLLVVVGGVLGGGEPPRSEVESAP